MSQLDRAAIDGLLATIIDPHHDDNLVTAGCVRGVGIDSGRVVVEIVLGYPAASYIDTLANTVKSTLEADPRIERATVDVRWQVTAHKVQQGLTPLPEVKNILAVASGKGGVGKSTTAVNVALALAAEGARVGMLDADIYGPSQPRMLGLSGKPEVRDGKAIVPKVNHGIQCMSIGFMVEEDTPMIWRGPMVTQALQQLLNETDWQGLDYLVIDLPPGTGDIQLTLCQRVPVSGALIVTTPQDIALLDARKGLKMFEKVAVPVLGIVENMSTHICSNCGHEEAIFGSGGGERMAAEYGVPLLGQMPLDLRIRAETDSGQPTVVAEPDSPIAQRYREIARKTAARLARQARNKSIGFPNIVIQAT
jgi:ATP-binding protein involved in chromosome partitioning